ncbi:MAG: hypothetical protein AAGD32_10495 [Planctomycetota bacterium]
MHEIEFDRFRMPDRSNETPAERLQRRHRQKIVGGVIAGGCLAVTAAATGTGLVLVVALLCFLAWRFERRWARPARALRVCLPQILDGTMSPDELNRVVARGGLAGIVPNIQRLARDK